ncbi:MAG: GAF domain-containing protein [Chloroflexi bacterium]|nr:GAF domain-containing protein [Chloroflexota bacterium]
MALRKYAIIPYINTVFIYFLGSDILERRFPISILAGLGVVLIVALIGVVTLFASSVIGRTVLDQFKVQQLQISTSVAQQTEAYFNSLTFEIISLASSPEIQGIGTSQTPQAIAAIEANIERAERQNTINSVTRYDFRGRPRYAWPSQYNDLIEQGEAYPFAIPPELLELTAEGGVIELPTQIYRVVRAGQARPDYLLITPVEARTGNTEYLVYELDLENIFSQDLSLDGFVDSESGQLWVLDNEGTLLYQARTEGETISDVREAFPATILQNILAGGDSVSRTYSPSGTERIAAIAPVQVGGYSFILMLSQDTDEASNLVAGDIQLISVMAIVTSILIAILVFFGVRRLVRETSRRRAEASAQRTARALLEVSRALNSSLDLQTVLDRILSELQKLIPFYSASILLLNDRGLLEVATHRGDDAEAHAQTTFLATEARAAREVIARGHPVIIQNTANDERWTPLPGSDIQSWMGLPLRVFERSVGVLNVNGRTIDAFTAQDVELAEAFSDQASVALQNARLHDMEVKRIEQELTVARGIQTSLLPTEPPNLPELEIAFTSLPARQVSGDYFQILPLPDRQLGIFIGDVSGKGMPAALIMAVITTALRDEINRHRYPGQLLNALNERLLDRLLQNQMNSALIAALFDPNSYEFTIANAGMVQPYVRDEDGVWDFVDVGGYPLGSSQQTHYTTKSLQLQPGRAMVLFSDGIVEAMNRRGEFFGFERLEHLLNKIADDANAEGILKEIVEAVDKHLDKEVAQDDITVMVLRPLQVERPALSATPGSRLSNSPDFPNGKELLDEDDSRTLIAEGEPAKKPSIFHHLDFSTGTENYSMPRQNVELFLPSTLGFEKVARNAAEAIAREMGFTEDRIDDLKTAVAEACMNAIEHGNLQDRSSAVTVLLSAAPGHLQIRVEDRGRQSIPDPLPAPGTSAPDRGWGLFFIQSLMDEVEITRLPEGGNLVKMTIYLGKTEGEPSESEPTSDASEWVDEAD